MKRIIIIIVGFWGLTSCEDFLKEKPRSEMSADQYFSDASHAYNAVNNLYRAGIVEFYGAGSAYAGNKAMLGGYMSGLFDNEYKGQEVHVELCHNLTLNSINMSGYLDGIWDPCYEAISRANTAVKYIPETPGLSEDEKDNLIAQALFFRAFNYYYLVKTFGDVPLILDPYESLEDIYVERTPSLTVYDQIVDDLNAAYYEIVSDLEGKYSIHDKEIEILQEKLEAIQVPRKQVSAIKSAINEKELDEQERICLEAVRMRQEGLSMGQIARELNMGIGELQLLLKTKR